MIGIIPAAGTAERMMGLPKMLLPIPDDTFLLKRMCQQIDQHGVDEIVVSCNPQTMSILSSAYVRPLYHDAGYTKTMSETLLSVNTRHHSSVLFAMPDTYQEDRIAFAKLSATLDAGADVAVGVFHAREGQHTEGGMVHFGLQPNGAYEVTGIDDKPAERVSDWIWGILAWKPVFWQHVDPVDPHVGFGVQRAVEAGLDVRAVKMDGGFWDAGTPERYFGLINYLTQGK